MNPIMRFIVEVIINKIKIWWIQSKQKKLEKEIKRRKEDVKKMDKINRSSYHDFMRKYEAFRSKSKYGTDGLQGSTNGVRKNSGGSTGAGGRAEGDNPEAGSADNTKG